MKIKKAGGRIFGASMSAAEKKAMDMEIQRQLAEYNRKHALEIDAMILWVLHLCSERDKIGSRFEMILGGGRTSLVILDNTGAIVATIKNGTISTSSSDITPILTYGVTSNGTVPDNDTSAMWLPAGQYTIQTTDSSSKEFEATLADVNQSATVSTSASSVTFAVNDDKALNYVQIDQAGVKYDITLSSTLDQGHDDVQLTGTTASGGVSFAQISGILYGEGVDSGAALKVDGKRSNDFSTPDFKSGRNGGRLCISIPYRAQNSCIRKDRKSRPLSVMISVGRPQEGHCSGVISMLYCLHN